MDREEQSSLGDPSLPPPTPSSPTAFQDINNFGKTTTSREKEVSYDRLHLEDTLGLALTLMRLLMNWMLRQTLKTRMVKIYRERN